MIEIVNLDGYNDGWGPLVCPVLVCDVCREQVVGHGNLERAYRHVDGEAVEQTPLYVTHKQPCSRVFDQWKAGAYPTSEGWAFGWDEARVVLDQLQHNLNNVLVPDYGYRARVIPLTVPAPKLTERDLALVRQRRREWEAERADRTAPR
jgi:hypothetical protein